MLQVRVHVLDRAYLCGYNIPSISFEIKIEEVLSDFTPGSLLKAG